MRKISDIAMLCWRFGCFYLRIHISKSNQKYSVRKKVKTRVGINIATLPFIRNNENFMNNSNWGIWSVIKLGVALGLYSIRNWFFRIFVSVIFRLKWFSLADFYFWRHFIFTRNDWNELFCFLINLEVIWRLFCANHPTPL